MRLFEMFAGIGAQAKALKKGEVMGVSEIDSKIFEAYCKIHNNGAKNYMGFSDEDYEKVSYMPRTLLYKMAGNSIVVSVLEEIFNTIEKLNFFIDNDKRI